MYEIIKNVIQNGDFELSKILLKIDILWAEGKLTDDQKGELQALARTKASAFQEIDLGKMCLELEDRCNKLEERIEALETSKEPGVDEPAEPEAPTEPEPFFEGKRYYNGDRITFEGKIYVCQNVPDGQCCVWSPSAYPNYWTLE